MELQQWLSSLGFNFVPILDNKRHRCDESGGKKSDHIWYIGSTEMVVGGRERTTLTVGNWRTDEQWYYSSGSAAEYSEEERRYYAKKQKEASEKAEREKLRDQERAAVEAERIWDSGQSVGEGDHPYLQKKQIGGQALTGIRQTCKPGEVPQLLIPMRDIDGKLWGIQRIFASGEKRFLTGQATKGCFFELPGKEPTLLCEGFATGASIHLATGIRTVIAFNAGNLSIVASGIRRNKLERILVAGDDDRWNPSGKNIGREKAEEAERECGGIAVFPEFINGHAIKGGELGIIAPTDFNDLHCLEGLDEVRRQITNAIPGGVLQDAPPDGTKEQGVAPGSSGEIVASESGVVRSNVGEKSCGEGDIRKAEDKKPKTEKKKISQEEIERLGKEILDCRFKLYVDNEATILYNITNIKKKELDICTNEEFLIRRLRQNIIEKNGKAPEIGFLHGVLGVWKLTTGLLKGHPKSFTWKNEDEWSFKKLDFVPEDGEYPAWWEFLSRLSSAEDFMAFIWSIFETKNISRQFLWLSDLNGEGGKSTVINVLAEIFGDSFEALNNTSTTHGARWLMGQLYGKRLAAWPDCKNTQFCMSEIVRNITSGDPVTVEMKGQPLFSTKMYMKLIIGSNYEPAITGSGADTSRLIHIKVDPGPKKDDPEWKDRLKAELPYFLYACQKVYEQKCPHHGKISLHESTIEHVENASGVTEERFEEIMESRLIIGEGLTATVKQFHDLCKEESFRDNFEIGNFKVFLKRQGVNLRRTGAYKPRLYYGMNILNRS